METPPGSSRLPTTDALSQKTEAEYPFLAEEFQIGLSLEQKNQMEKLKDQDLISWESPILKLTTEGMLLADAITAELMPELKFDYDEPTF